MGRVTFGKSWWIWPRPASAARTDWRLAAPSGPGAATSAAPSICTIVARSADSPQARYLYAADLLNCGRTGGRASASERITHSNYVGLMNLKFASFYLGRGAERRRSGARFEGIDPAVVEVFDLDDFVDVGRAAEVGQHLIAVARARPDHAVVREPREAQRGETVAGQAVLLSSRAARYRGARERESGECEGASLCSDRITSSELSVELRSPNTPPSAPERTPVTSSWSAEAAAFFTFTDHAGSSLSTIKLTN